MYTVYCIYMLTWTRRSHTCFTDFLWKVCSDYITGFAFQISVGRGLLHILTASAGDSTDKMTQVSGFPPAVLHFAFWGCLDQKLWWELKPLKGFLFSRGVLALMDTPCFKTMKTVLPTWLPTERDCLGVGTNLRRQWWHPARWKIIGNISPSMWTS